MIKFTHHETVFEDGVEVHRFKPFLNTISNESRARILQDMNDGLDQMTDFQIAGTTRLLSFESLYRCVYNAILKNLGVEWHRKVEECAKDLPLNFETTKTNSLDARKCSKKCPCSPRQRFAFTH